jgi:DNA-directed RNA polymerase subunit omega
MKLEDGFDSNYRFVLVAARRARQLQNGSQPLVASRSTKACRVAQDEIAAGKVRYVRGEDQDHAPKDEAPAPEKPADTSTDIIV